MIPTNRTATHPGIILLKEFLDPLDLTQKALAMHVGISVPSILTPTRPLRFHLNRPLCFHLNPSTQFGLLGLS